MKGVWIHPFIRQKESIIGYPFLFLTVTGSEADIALFVVVEFCLTGIFRQVKRNVCEDMTKLLHLFQTSFIEISADFR
jgi:hypothetical protein